MGARAKSIKTSREGTANTSSASLCSRTPGDREKIPRPAVLAPVPRDERFYRAALEGKRCAINPRKQLPTSLLPGHAPCGTRAGPARTAAGTRGLRRRGSSLPGSHSQQQFWSRSSAGDLHRLNSVAEVGFRFHKAGTQLLAVPNEAALHVHPTQRTWSGLGL